jgi:DNA repair exonuclease SbcCD ATPase subunit
MKINYIRAQNFLSIGEKPIEIDFTKLGNIVNIRGYNLDGGPGASNGAGKSTIIETLSYGFYGKLIKGLNHKEAINIRSKKGLEVEIHWDDYKLIRKRAPDKLHLWKGDEEISLGGIPATDELLKGILRLNHSSFVNVSCFGQHNVKAFLACDSGEKRKIAENLLSLDRYLKFNKVAKDKVKILKEKIGQMSVLYQSSLQDVANSTKKKTVLVNQQNQWLSDKKEEINKVEKNLAAAIDKLNGLKRAPEVRVYENARKEMDEVESAVKKKDKQRADLHAILEKAETAIQQRRDEKQNLAIEISSHERELKLTSAEIEAIAKICEHAKGMQGAVCDHCYGDITEQNIRRMMERDIGKIKTLQTKWNDANKKKKELEQQLASCDSSLSKLMEGRKAAREKELVALGELNNLLERKKELASIQRPDVASEILLVEKDVEHLRSQLAKCQSEKDPYVSMLEMVDKEVSAADSQSNVYKKDIKDLEGKMPYFNFWVKAFGDDGIRSFIINEIVPALNSRINYWLQYLMDGRVKVTFNNQLEETIERIPYDDDPFVYNSLSGGEHCRIDLAISQAFAHVMMMTSGTCPSIVALDEVGANIDRPGIHSIYRMVCELARDRQVIFFTVVAKESLFRMKRKII